jgi:hypothetical protein
VKLKDVSNSKTRKITELQTIISTTKGEFLLATDSPARSLAMPSIVNVGELACTECHEVAPSHVEAAKQHKVRTDHGKLYSETLRGKVKHTHYKLTVTSQESKSSDTIKEILKSNINPTEIQVGISSIKTLGDGKVQIEARNKDDIEKLGILQISVATNLQLGCRN